jgi:hypothetical protein
MVSGFIYFPVMIVAALIIGGVLFAPTIIAFARNHPQRWSIFGLNFSVGGSNWGWGAALTWALQNLEGQRVETVSTEQTFDDDLQECPHCAETIKAKAKVCRYCGNKLSQEQPA